MPTAICTVVGATAAGGWSPFGASFPADLNDANDLTYEFIAGNTTGEEKLLYDYTAVPDGATITTVAVSGRWGAGSTSATATLTCYLGGNTTVLATIGDVTTYSFNIARPGGGSWTKTDLQTATVGFNCLGTGNGNAVRNRQSYLSVAYTGGGSATGGLLGGIVPFL